MRADLHTHTTASDGALQPQTLIDRALEQGVELLSITDHDTLDGYRSLSVPEGLTLIRGIELSSRWQKSGIHVVGLNVRGEAMDGAIANQKRARADRAAQIADRLHRATGVDLLEAARTEAGHSQVGRPHFARAMVAAGLVGDAADAFRRYLGRGKVGDIRQHWPGLGRVVGWIRDAGGIAVLAHPARYRMTATRLKKLLTSFKAVGGEAMEVVSGTQNPQVTQNLADMCEAFGLLASCGSDFHQPAGPWSELGRYAPLPDHCRPVWDAW
ncbi:MAG: PHP domain-containing protein [Xanthomonadales bacterium]|nr:PHP domain-containing protein [Xanthomonadales bacterium]